MNRQMTIEMSEEMHAELERQAAAAGMTLEEYLTGVVITRVSREHSSHETGAEVDAGSAGKTDP
jgi:hypothetical protein